LNEDCGIRPIGTRPCRGISARLDRLSDVSELSVWHTTGIIIRTQGCLGSSAFLRETLHQTFDPCLPCITPFTKHTMKQFPSTTRNYYTPIMKLATTMSSVSCGRLRIAFTCCRHRYSYLSTMISQLVPKGCRGPGQIPVFSIRRAPAGQRPAERPRRLSAGASIYCRVLLQSGSMVRA